MAECIRFVCSGCGFSVESWSDGNPFYIDEAGNKRSAYHPNHEELAKCVANDVPHLCLECGSESTIDSRNQSKVCSACGSPQVVETWSLKGVDCPKCKAGQFSTDEDFHCIS
jgi:hypothetical protein